MSELGVGYFDPQYQNPVDRPWFDGSYFDSATAAPVAWEPANNAIVLPNLAGGSIIQLLYTGSKAPSLQQAYPFDLHWTVGVQADYERILAAKSRGTPVDFCAGFRVCDTFLATSGSTYTLSRPIANDVVTGITVGLYPVRILLDGVDTPSAADVAVQTVTANNTGEITVFYTPLHRVLVASLKHTYESFNRLEITCRLDEIISGVFDA
jgi:hypothetical protein